MNKVYQEIENVISGNYDYHRERGTLRELAFCIKDLDCRGMKQIRRRECNWKKKFEDFNVEKDNGNGLLQ